MNLAFLTAGGLLVAGVLIMLYVAHRQARPRRTE